MANHSVSILLTLLVFVFAAATVASGLGGGGGTMVGGRTKVHNVKANKEIQDLGRFSVERYNHEQKNGGDLKFQSVLEAETQVVAGTKYFLKISVADGNGVPKAFDAVLVVKPWEHSKELLGFSPSPVTK